MAKTTFTVDEILQEYSADGKKSGYQRKENVSLPSGRLETEKMLSATKPSQMVKQQKKQDELVDIKSTILNIKHKKEQQPAIPQDSAIAQIYAQETPRKTVSFVQSPALKTHGMTAPTMQDDEAYDEAVILQKALTAELHRPNIRQMESATQAKEQRKRAKKQAKRKNSDTRRSVRLNNHTENDTTASATEKAKRFHKKQQDFYFRLSEEQQQQHKPEPTHIHIPNRDAEILENIHTLRNAVFFRTAMLLLLSILGCILAFCETPENKLYTLLIDRLSARGYCILELTMAAIAIITAFPTMKNGLRNLLKCQADCDSMAVLPMITGVAAAIITCFAPDMLTSHTVNLYIPAALLALLLNSIGKLLIIRRASRNYGILSKPFEKYVLTYVRSEDHAEQLTRGVINDLPILAAVRKANQLSDFLRYTYSSDTADHFCRIATPILSIVSMITAVGLSLLRYGTVWSLNTVCSCLSILAALITISCCMGAAIVVNLPLDVISKQAAAHNRVLLGYQSVDDYYDTNAILLDAAALFPKGTVKVNGIKLFSTFKIDETLLHATSLVHHAGSFLEDAFEDVVMSKKGLYPVEDFQYEDSMGICGWVQNRRILLGNREMMSGHNVEGLPTRTREAELAEGSRDVIYLSISGNLAAMFLLDIQADLTVKKWMQEMKQERVALVLKSVDSCLSLQKLSELFQFPEHLLKILPSAMHDLAEQETTEKDCESATMICDGSFAGIAQLLTGVKKIRRASMTGLVLQAVTAVLGVSLGIIHLIIGANATLTAQLYILYQLICTAVTALAVRRLK